MCRFAYVATVAAGAALLVLVGCGKDKGVAPFSPIGAPPAFTEFPGLDLTGVNGYGRSLAWGDCDNDLDLDLAVAGCTGAVVTTKVYENDGAGGLAEFEGLDLTDAGSASLAWGDCDSDGDIDVAIAGSTGSAFITTVHENDSARNFAAFPGLDLVGVKYGSLAWGDCDNDGDLDLAVAGWFSYGSHTTIYENNGAGGFAEFPDLDLPNAFECSLAWGDADNDGDLDLAVAGASTGGYITKVFENDGAGGFTELASVTGVYHCSVAWGDADNDGDLDLAVAGWSMGGRITTVYENDGAGGFTEFPGLDLKGVDFCSLSWGDCDNDGDLDLAVAGDTGSGYVTTVYGNDGAGGFAEILGPGLTGAWFCSLAWGDADGDGDLDLAVMGLADAGRITTVYENHCALPNSPPDAPTGLGATLAAGKALLAWLPASDDFTPDAGLSYNLRVRNTGAPAIVIDGMADPTTGWRRIPALGPVRPDASTCSWTLKGLPPGNYEFQVQAIDSALAGGPWSAAEPFTVPTP